MIADSGIESGSSPEINSSEEPPMSRTHQYRKVMKPLLERKRRARINKCLDNLKDIMVNTLQAEGESITKLEKADVLELTVKHLRKLKRQNALGLTPQATYAGRFRAGYSHCAQEVGKFMSQQTSAEIDTHASARLLSHLSGCIHALESMPPSILTMAVSPNNIPPPAPSAGSPTTPPISQAPGNLHSATAYAQPKLSSAASPISNYVSLSSASDSQPQHPTALAMNSLSPSITSPRSSSSRDEYASSLAIVAASAQQHYSALLQNSKMAQQKQPSSLPDSRIHSSYGHHLSVLNSARSPYPHHPSIQTDFEEYRRALAKSSAVLCGIDDKAWRPW